MQLTSEKEILRLKKERTEEFNLTTVKDKNSKLCHYCSKPIDEEEYYVCLYHKNIFCYNCAMKTGDLHPSEYPKCAETKKKYKDCIWVKHGITD